MSDLSNTQFFQVEPGPQISAGDILEIVFKALKEKGYNPVNQIVGFPGETEEEFEASYAFVDRVDFYETHIFKYSKREGTKAAVMDGQIDEKIKGERSARMIALGERKKKAYEDSFIGKEVEVLFEERAQIEGKAVMTGHTKEYMKIALETEKNISNCIVKVRIENHSQIIR